MNMIVFPSYFYDIHKVDEDLRQEYDAVLASGLYDVALFSYDAWFNDGKLVFDGTSDIEREAVYRGWMMQPEQYERFYAALLSRGVRLVTPPEAYRLMHVFPNVYHLVEEDTAKMEIFPLHTQIDVEELKRKFGRFMVKDYVKSVKGTEFPRYFGHDVTQEDLDRWMEVFYKYRGDLLTGGICIKEYLDLKRYGDHTNEYRVFYINHEIATVCRNSLQGNYTPEPPASLIQKYRNLDSPYYTVDYAELENGSWRVIEAGDGEVSGLSDGQDYEQYFRALYHCFN